ncbi:winged helix-turn-helix domain-containing protein [Acrocarpospora catenulata]|uniref:winged helix-turn-helix domain-containing protein n=1 Tax=Acrocarpospora catenulata TaxID=2836182 RepID=UPI001BDB2FA0|nr:winged helix-turn-helix domain-containing protein [Acrocarpospora catenulata]
MAGQNRDGAEPGLDRGSDTPLYAQLADRIEKLIRSGKLAPGDRVSSESEIVREFGVSMKTARNAHQALQRRGLVHTVAGAGTFVGSKDTPPAPYVMPTYLVIADELAGFIRRGDIPTGEKIPSRTMLARQYEVTIFTVAEAVAVLRDKGWLVTVPRNGHFVTPADRWPSAEEWRKTIARPRGAREPR